ncbi:MAG TPA: J domain-containing protein [Candidatus Limnocylindrales bacterium]|jgi:curved DNA-binding protein CbpA
MDPYKVLQVDPEAEDEVIQAAYRRLAQKYHPDVAGPDGSARMASINAAWELLRDPASRAAVDRERRIARHAEEGARQAEDATRQARAAAGSRPAQPPQHGGASSGPAERPPETVSSDWSSGRSSVGGGYDPSRMRAADGYGAAGPPPGDPSGTVLGFGRYAGWSLGEVARRDVDYIEWLDRMPIGRPYRDEIDVLLRKSGRRRSATTDTQRRGLFRR